MADGENHVTLQGLATVHCCLRFFQSPAKSRQLVSYRAKPDGAGATAASRSAAFFAASAGYASLFFYAAIIALCSERRAVTFNGLARRVFFSLL